MILIDSIREAEKILIVGHMRPDGDCLGAGLALYRLALGEGKTAEVVYDSDIPEHFSFLPDYKVLNVATESAYDLVIAVDCGDDLRMGKYLKFLKKAKRSIQYDHHISNNNFAEYNFVYPEKSSTCEILADELLPTGKVTPEIASYLFVGLSTDTGRFMHNNVTKNVFDTAAALLECGADCYNLNMALYRSKSINKTRLMGKAIDSMRFFEDDSICIITITQEDLEDTGCTIGDTEGIIDLAMDLACVKVAVCMTASNEAKYKVSFRSKGVNVAACASVFGGGGHVQAAGCVAFGLYEDVVTKIVSTIRDVMYR